MPYLLDKILHRRHFTNCCKIACLIPCGNPKAEICIFCYTFVLQNVQKMYRKKEKNIQSEHQTSTDMTNTIHLCLTLVW